MCYLPDKLGSIRDTSDPSGNPVFTSLYKAFGQITQEIGNLLSGDRFRFTGREYDSDTGLYYYRARYYDPILGRFISEDPIRFDAGDLNVYRYVGNQATAKVDPSGAEAILSYNILNKVSLKQVVVVSAAAAAATCVVFLNATFIYESINSTFFGGKESLGFALLASQIPDACQPNQMRLQLQFERSRERDMSEEMQNLGEVGVTLAQFEGAADRLIVRGKTWHLFPSQLNSWLESTLAKAKIWARRVRDGGGISGRTSYTVDESLGWRVDAENMRGYNLRR